MAHCIIVISLHPPSSPFAPSASALPSIPSHALAHSFQFKMQAMNACLPPSFPLFFYRPPLLFSARGIASCRTYLADQRRTRRSQHQDKQRQQLNAFKYRDDNVKHARRNTKRSPRSTLLLEAIGPGPSRPPPHPETPWCE